MNTKNRPRFGGFGVYAMLILLVIILWYTFTNNSTTSDFTQNNLWKAIREEKVVSIRVEQNREVPTGYLNIKLKDGSTERMYTSDVNEIQKELKEKDDKINNLQRAKSSLNVKQTGEDLESWCDNEVNSYMQNGLLNCTWIKVNFNCSISDSFLARES